MAWPSPTPRLCSAPQKATDPGCAASTVRGRRPLLAWSQGTLVMKIYLLSLGAGLLVGVIYSLLHVRSPAPPLIALIGLSGILMGEQIIPLGQRVLAGARFASAWRQAQCGEHLFGALPGSAPGSAPG